jgi:hypothetical protein
MNPAFAFAPLRLSLSASRGAPRHVLSLPYPPPQRLVREGGGVVKVLRVSYWAARPGSGAIPGIWGAMSSIALHGLCSRVVNAPLLGDTSSHV